MWKLAVITLTIFQTLETAHPQEKVHMGLTSSDNVHFVVTDPSGRRAGRDPRGAASRAEGIEIGGIPNAHYAFESVGDIPDSNETPNPIYYHEFAYTFGSPQGDGLYKIEMIGIESSRFDFYISVDPASGSARQRCRFVLKGAVIEQDSMLTYHLLYNGALDTPIHFKKIALPSTLRQDLSAAYKLNLLGDKKFFDELNNQLDKFERTLTKGKEDSVKARKELEEFEKKIDKEREETTKHEQRGQKDKRFLAADAYEILKEDISLLRRQFPDKQGR